MIHGFREGDQVRIADERIATYSQHMGGVWTVGGSGKLSAFCKIIRGKEKRFVFAGNLVHVSCLELLAMEAE